MHSTRKGEASDVVVTVSWGTYALAAHRVARGEAFALGEGGFLPLPRGTLGADRVEYVRVTATGRVLLELPVELVGTVRLDGNEIALEAFVNDWQLVNGLTARPRSVELPTGAVVDLALAGSLFALRVEVAGADERIPRGITHQLNPWAFAMTALSLALHGALVGVFVLTRQGLESEAQESLDRDQVLFMRAMLQASAERELDRPPPPSRSGELPEVSGGTSSAAAGPEGRAGASTSRSRTGGLAVAGAPDNPDPHVQRDRLLDAVDVFGLAGILSSEAASTVAVASAWSEHDRGVGRDRTSAIGSLFDESPGDAFGADGLGVAGSALGGGGDAAFVGLDRVHGLDVAAIGGPKGGLGGRGIGGRDGPAGHRPRSPGLRAAAVETNGRLPAELIQRVLRQQSGRLRFCYEAGLGRNPNLEGRVAVRFVINRDGAVSLASDAGSDLPDATVVSCIVQVVAGLTFPEPPDGIVTVTYPVVLSPAQ